LIHDDGDTFWTLTHSDDFAKYFFGLLMLDDVKGQIFNVVSSDSHKWIDIFEIYGRILKQKLHIHSVPSEYIYLKDKLLGLPIIGDKQKNMIFDNSKLKSFVNNQKLISLEKGLIRSINWSKNNIDKVHYNKSIKARVDRLITSHKEDLIRNE
jgi:nucleoside-diphosphate-sugar epimerase